MITAIEPTDYKSIAHKQRIDRADHVAVRPSRGAKRPVLPDMAGRARMPKTVTRGAALDCARSTHPRGEGDS